MTTSPNGHHPLPAEAPATPAQPDPLRSVHTSNLPAIPDQLGISLAVSTYQAGKVILVRNDDGVINTHFRTFHKPMGIAADSSRLTIGGANTVWYYRNMPSVGQKVEPAGQHDACFLPRQIHVTGDIDIHEMAYDADGGLWVVNTRFCTPAILILAMLWLRKLLGDAHLASSGTPFRHKEPPMPLPLSDDPLQAMLRQHTAHLPDFRQPSPHTSYTIQDAAFGAFGLFFTPSPSFLASQRRRQHSKGHNNAQTWCGVGQIPCDHQVRALLERGAPSHCTPVFLEGVAQLNQAQLLEPLRVLDPPLFVALDGPQYFSATALRGPHGLTRQLANGQTLYYHPALPPVGVRPGHAQGLACPPAYSMPPEGQDTQDGEQAAGKRWLRQDGAALAPSHVTCLGDELYSQQPCCAWALEQGGNFLRVGQPDSHAKWDERLAFWQVQDAMVACAQRRNNGRLTAVAPYRFVNDVLRHEGPQALSVHWVEITVLNATTGAPLYDNPFLTNHRGQAEAVAQVAQAGRGRWQGENANNNVLKPTGDHLEQTFGPGKQYLSATRRSLNLFACLFQTVGEWSAQKYPLLRQVLARRHTFFDDMHALTRYMVFPSWHHLMDFMIRGLERESKLNPDLGPPLNTS